MHDTKTITTCEEEKETYGHGWNTTTIDLTPKYKGKDDDKEDDDEE